MKDYYQIPITMTDPIETLIKRRIKDLKQKYPEVVLKRGISRALLGLGSYMWSMGQTDEVLLQMLDLASANMTMCRKKK